MNKLMNERISECVNCGINANLKERVIEFNRLEIRLLRA